MITVVIPTVMILCKPALAEAVAEATEAGTREEGWFQQEITRFRSYPRLDRAYRRLERGRPEEALIELEAYLEIRPNDHSVRQLFASVLLRAGRYQDAIRESSLLLTRHAPMPEARLTRAMARQANAQLDAAADDFYSVMTDQSTQQTDRLFAANSFVVITCPKFQQFAKQNQGADVLLRAKQCHEQVKRARTNAGERTSRNSRATYWWSYAQLNSNTLVDAGRVDADEAASSLPSPTGNERQPDVEAAELDENANAAAESGNMTAAIALLEKADKLQPTAERQYRLGEWSQKLGRNEDAINHLKLARDRDPKTPLYVETLAYTYKGAERFDEAARAFREALELEPERTDLRQDLAYTYWQANDFSAACDQFDEIVKRTGSAQALLEAGQCKRQIKLPDEALGYWVKTLAKVESLEAPQRKQLYDEMGYLYYERGELAPAIDSWNRSLQVQLDVAIAVQVSVAEREQNHLDAAEAVLKSVAGVKASKEVEAARAEEWANIEKARRRLPEATSAPEKSEAIVPDVPAEDRDATLAYEYKNAGQLDAAIRSFETALAQQPGRVDLQQDLAYTYLQAGDGTNAVRVFKNAIDSKLVERDSTSEADARAADQSIEGMRREVSELEKRHTFSLYESYRARGGPNLGSSPSGVGVIPSQGAAEYDYRITDSGNRQPIQAFGRVLWGSQAGSLSAEHDSLQGGVGLHYKPFAEQDFFFTGERLIKIGDNAQNEWLLHASYGWSRGYELRSDVNSWNTFTLYSDVGYFTGSDTWAAYAELREGRTFRIANNMMLMPHVTVSGLYQHPDPYDGSYSEAGVGVSLRYLFNETKYSAPRSSAEFLVQYKKGLSTQIPGGWVVTTVVIF